MKKTELISYLDRYLKISEIEDYSKNGLQVGDDGGEVDLVAFAVDASLASFEKASEKGASLLIVHHGLFWKDIILPKGIHFKRLESLIKKGLTLYGVHLPLDYHGECGNNQVMAAALDLDKTGEMRADDGTILVKGELKEALDREGAVEMTEKKLGLKCLLWPFGPEKVRKIGICSGGASSLIPFCAEADLDLFLTGEPSHTYYHYAIEGRLNVAFGGHYETETFGLKALRKHIEEKFKLQTVFLDIPTGH